MKLLPYEPGEDWVSGPRERRRDPEARVQMSDIRCLRYEERRGGVLFEETSRLWDDEPEVKCRRCGVMVAGDWPKRDGYPHCQDCIADIEQDALDAQEATP